MTTTLFKLAASIAIAGAALSAQAQTTPAANGAPASVGVSPGTAADAASKAVPRSDTGTLVRTAPNAADRARTATDGVTTNTGNTNATTGAAITAPTPTAGAAATTAPAPRQRARRADRN